VTRYALRALLPAVALCAACEARQSHRDTGATAAVTPAGNPATTVSVAAANPPQPPTVVTLTQSGVSPRFGLVTKLRNGHVCLTIPGDSLADSTAATVVLYSLSERGDSSKSAVRALIVGYSSECGDSLPMMEGQNYALHSASDAPLGEGVGVVGGIDTLTVSANRAVVRFPNDSAHWSFDVCSSTEGLHYNVNRMSADSIITLWDGYRYLGYDVVADCPGARDIPRAAELKSLVGAWKAGHHDEETAMSLVIARWEQCWDADDDRADGDSATGRKSELPPMSALLEAAGSPGKLSAENQFVFAWFAFINERCFDNALPRTPQEMLAEARRREPSSALFQDFGDGVRAKRDVEADRAEIHRRFDGRGEHFRYLADYLRRQP